MALVPNVTQLSPATWDAAGVIDAVQTHLAGTPQFLQSDGYNAGEGLTIGFSSPGEGHQTVLTRSSSTEIGISIEPTGSITDPGDSSPTAPTGVSSDWSGHNTTGSNLLDVSAGSPGAGSKLWLVELPDAFFLLATDTANTYVVWILHAGRITQSMLSSGAAAAGQDGLGYAAGTLAASGAAAWMNNASSSGSLHWATEEWSQAVFSAAAGIQVPSSAHTNWRPLPPLYAEAYYIAGSNSRGSIGVFKYVRWAPANTTTLAVLADGASNQGMLLTGANSSAANRYCIFWDKTVTP